MGILQAILYGIVQGLTEFLPISSSAHLRIVGEFLGRDPGAAFTAIIQLGTEAAVLVYFWRDIVRIVQRWFLGIFGRIPRTDPDYRLGWLIIIGTIPVVVIGYLLQDTIETTFRSLWFVAVTFVVFGVLLGLADRFGRSTKTLKDMTVGQGVIYGIAQAFALIPGVSRSGGTLTAGRLMGFTREAAARYSFLIAIPAVFGSGLFELYSTRHTGNGFGAGPTLIATIVSFVVGLAVIHYFLRYISRGSFLPFVIYRIIAGLVLAVLLASGVLAA